MRMQGQRMKFMTCRTYGTMRLGVRGSLMSYTTMSSKMCAIERVCERKSDGPEFGLLVTSKSNQPKYYFPTHRPPNKD